MGYNNWKKIWSNKDINILGNNEMSNLLRIDGFDSPTGLIKESDWLTYVENIISELEITSDFSIYEVGVGAGAFLYPIYNQYTQNVGGIDYSEKLIGKAKSAMPNGDFICGDALELDVSIEYDILLSNSVFFYFPNEAYAEKVIDKMLKKTKSKVVILDVNDKDKKYIAEKKRRNMLSQSEYEKKYKDLQHLYYNKQFFIDIAIKYNYKIKIFKQKIYNYSANFYRFNVIIDKHSDFDKNINGA